MAKEIANSKEQHRINKKPFKRRIKDKWREIVDEKKVKTGAVMEKQTLPFEKDEKEFNCDSSGASFVTHIE